MHHPSYILGAKMALAMEIHTHRNMCDVMLKKFISAKKLIICSLSLHLLILFFNLFRFDLCLFCESYLEHISEKSTEKVKKNGLTYLII